MATETITIEIDAALAARLRAKGIEPSLYVARALKRAAWEAVDPQTHLTQDPLTPELRAELEDYERFMADHPDWNAGLRTF